MTLWKRVCDTVYICVQLAHRLDLNTLKQIFVSGLFTQTQGGYTSSWIAFIGGCWSHTQGAVSAIVSVVKKDIWCSFWEMMTCGRGSGVNGWRASFSFRASHQFTQENNRPCTTEEEVAVENDLEGDDDALENGKQVHTSRVPEMAPPEEVDADHDVESDAATPP